MANASAKQQIFNAIHSNTNHQYALEKYNQRLAAELQEIDKLLAAADIGDSDDEVGDVEIQGAIRPAGPIPETEFLIPASPFYNEGIKRSRYINFTVTHPMKPKELEVLTEAVTSEFRRLKALDSMGHGINEPIDLTADVGKLNWKAIAEKVTDVSAFTRTDRECKTRWLGHHRPGINHDEWTAEEVKRLEGIVAAKQRDEGVKLNWVEIAQELATNRTPMDCMRKGFNRARHTWTAEADKKLLEGVEVYGLENWALVALHVSPNVTTNQCQMRYIRTFDPSLNRSPWTSDEDARMNKLVSVLGTTDWPDVARHMPGRTNEMCRERYTEGRKGKGKGKAKAKGEDEERDSEGETAEKTEKAGTSRKTDWTEAQDTELIRLVGEIGNKWQKISEAMGGVYNNNQCRGRFIRLKHENKVPDNALAETITKPSKWTAEQDAELIRLVGETGNQWQKISQAMGGTHGNNQCRARYVKLKKENKVEPPDANNNANPSMASGSTSSPMPTPVSTSASQPLASDSTLVTEPAPATAPTPAPAKSRPKPKIKSKPKPGTSEVLEPTSNSAPSVSNDATPSSASISNSTAKRKRPSRRIHAVSAAIVMDLDSLQLKDAGPSVSPAGALDAGGNAEINEDGVSANDPSRTEPEPRTSASTIPLRPSSRHSQALSAAISKDLEEISDLSDLSASTSSAAAASIGATGASSRTVTADIPTATMASNTRSVSTRKRARVESNDPASLSPSKLRARSSVGRSPRENNGQAESASTGISSPSLGPARKKGRTRKSTTADGNITTIGTPSTGDSSPSTPASAVRRSSRLAEKD